MKMRTLWKLKTLAHRQVRGRRREFDLSDEDCGPPPEAVFDRLTGPFGSPRAIAMPGTPDEET